MEFLIATPPGFLRRLIIIKLHGSHE